MALNPVSSLLEAQERALANDERLATLNLNPLAVAVSSLPVADRVVSASAKLTIEGASTVTIGLFDPDHLIEQSDLLDAWADGKLDAIDITFDGLTWRLASASRQDPDVIQLVFEDLVVALLRSHTKHLTASRGSVTRGQFIARMVREVKTVDIPFFSPEKGVKQPVAAAKYPTVDTGPSSSGFDKDVSFTINGAKAGAEQIKNASILMGVCDQEDVTPRVRLAILAAAIGESNISAIPNRGGSPYGGVLQGKIRSDGQGPKQFDINDTEGMARCFLKGGKGYQAGGAIKLARENPGMSIGTIAYLVEGDISNFSSAAAAEHFYQQHHDDAKVIADRWNSGAAAGAKSDAVVYAKQYQFTRGMPGKPESSWTAANRLAGEVNWRFFVVGGVASFVKDDYMLMTPADHIIDGYDDPGLIGAPTFDWDYGKVSAEITQRVSANTWSVVPATVVYYGEKFGKPVAGRWLVHTVDQNLLDTTDCEITLIKPLPPRKEPAPEIATRSKDKTDATGAKGNVKVDPGNGSFVAQTTRPDGKRVTPNPWLTDYLARIAGRVGHTIYTNTYSRHPEFSSSNLPSDHWTGDGADLNVTNHGGNYPNPFGTEIARAAFELAGASSVTADKLARGGGTYTRLVTTDAQKRKISVQVLWGPNVGHVDHVHIGVRLA